MIQQLSHGDAGKRDAARRILLAHGTRALPELRRARQEGDAKLRETVRALIEEIQEREPFGLRFNAGVPRMRLSLEFTYRFDRAAAKKRCDPEWKPLDDPEKPWNKALEFEHTFRTEMRVHESR